MRLLHTSDWHLGRSLHRHDLRGAQERFLDHLVEVVRAERVDVVVHSGDVHDRALPPVDALELLADTLGRLRDAGATVVVISGNHDAPLRLGDKSGLLDRRIRIRTDPATLATPVVVDDRHGPVAFYPLPYLEPVLVAGRLPAAEDDGPGEAANAAGEPPGRSGGHARVLARAMSAVRADLARRGGRSVAIAHTWVAGAAGSESERDITVGGLACVPADTFTGPDYVALGHLHRPQVVREGMRYAGSPLPYSFGERDTPKASWLVELGARGLARVEEVPAPVFRAMSSVRGRLAELLADPALGGLERNFLAVTLTDPVRPAEAMARLSARFPFVLTLDFDPDGVAGPDGADYRSRIRGRSDLEVAAAFFRHVRTDPDPAEREVLASAFEASRLVTAGA